MIRVGVVGANPERGWAARAHLPALRELPGVELTAVATTRRESAEEAARRYGARYAFADAHELINHPEVDVVTVAVRLPHHRDLVTAAVKAGKHVYCEWPLVVHTADAVELRDLADRRGVRHAVGLQARHNPAVRRLRDLLAEGHIGEVLSATLSYAMPSPLGPAVPAGMTWLTDAAQGANVMTISGGHALDVVRHALGEFREVSAVLTTRTPHRTIRETGEPLQVTSPDQVLISGVLENGVPVSAHIQWGGPESTGLRLEIHGRNGLLALAADRSLNGGPLRLSTGEVFDDPPSTAVAALYTAFAAAIENGSPMNPDFDTAVGLHRLLDAVRAAARSGQRQELTG